MGRAAPECQVSCPLMQKLMQMLFDADCSTGWRMYRVDLRHVNDNHQQIYLLSVANMSTQLRASSFAFGGPMHRRLFGVACAALALSQRSTIKHRAHSTLANNGSTRSNKSTRNRWRASKEVCSESALQTGLALDRQIHRQTDQQAHTQVSVARHPKRLPIIHPFCTHSVTLLHV
jgi:hypothetical protein